LQHLINEGEGEMVLPSDRIQFSVINTHPPPCGLLVGTSLQSLFCTTVMPDFIGTTWTGLTY